MPHITNCSLLRSAPPIPAITHTEQNSTGRASRMALIRLLHCVDVVPLVT
jgi:hypothetical protein